MENEQRRKLRTNRSLYYCRLVALLETRFPALSRKDLFVYSVFTSSFSWVSYQEGQF